MPMPWFRMHHEARTDAKLRTLADDEFRVWFNLLCYAAEQDNRGRIDCADGFLLAIEVAGGDEELLTRVLQKLKRLRIVCWDGDDEDPGDILTFIHFDDRNYDKPSDHPDRVAERVKRHRAKNETPPKRDVTPRNDPDKIRLDKIRLEEIRLEESREEENTSPRVSAADGDDYPSWFEEIWLHYPLKVGKAEAYKALKRRKVDEPLRQKIIAAIECQKQSHDWTKDGGEFIPHMSTWVRREGWNDELRPARASPNGQHLSPQQRRQQQLLAIANGETP